MFRIQYSLLLGENMKTLIVSALRVEFERVKQITYISLSKVREEQIGSRLAATGFFCNLCDLHTAPSCHMPTKSLISAFTL